ncbi:MAG: aminoacetone oxidase family FAD-binding enzyme, partial [Oscillospiraceae bacterium]|nr:aminoacetone oxidase family FAD-binding enzyme [Oscillospiraceae bacterium]
MTAAVMGGGASGIMAAIAAAEEGADVILLERLDRVGKKILATGNGRCNITNMNVSPENYYSIGKSTGQTAAARKFAGDVIGRFGAENTLEFFDSIGVMTRAEDKGRVYPYTGQASSVLDALRFRMDVLGVKTICGFEARKIEKAKDGGFEIVSYSGERIRADKAVVACGGRSSPSLGSNGSGYDILKMLGHSVTEVYPSLVQIETDRSVVKGLAGI